MNMKSRLVQHLLRLLITLLGAGLGAAAFTGIVQLVKITNPTYAFPLRILVVGYVGLMLLGAGICFLLSRRILKRCMELGIFFERKLDEMSLGQLVSCSAGLVFGLVVAALLSQILHFMGDSMFTTIMSCILFLVFGMMGFNIGRHRAQEVDVLLRRSSVPQLGRFIRKKTAHHKQKKAAVSRKLLDTSVLIDGRVVEVCCAGFLEGELVVPDFVMDELRRVADATDTQKRAKGRRGMEMLEKLKAICPVSVEDTTGMESAEVDVMLLRLARKQGGSIVTCDYNLARAAQVTGVKALNLNELAGALRPAVQSGDELLVSLTKEGKEPGQGVAYLEDGTMVVVEGGRRHMGETLTVVVTTVLQTSAGRMIFARLKPAGQTNKGAE